MKKVSSFWIVAALLVFLVSCKADNISPIAQDDSAPDPVSDVEVENLPGGAKITYNLPESKSLRYVKAVFDIGDGNRREVKSSYYDNSLTVEGFPDTREYEGQLYAVSRGEKESEPVSVTIQPLTPPVIEVFQTITIQETFGGVRVNFENEAEAEISLTVLTADSLGDLVEAEKYYSESRMGTFAARGFATQEREFAVFVEDRWHNRSDTVHAELIPLFEEELDKVNFREVNLPTDTYEQHCCGDGMTDLWDEVWDVGGNTLHTKPNTGFPQWFTFDLGVKAQLSRFKFYHRAGGTDGAYYAGDPKIFEIWGSNDPEQDGSWGSWTRLGTFESVKPSGEGTPTDEDIQYAVVDGEDFDFPDPEEAPAVRYLRFKTIENWGGVTYIYLSELTFWGSIVEEGE